MGYRGVSRASAPLGGESATFSLETLQTINEIVECRSSPRKRLDRAAEYRRCAEDIVYWVDNYCWTFDPRLPEQSTIPFKTFPRQQEFLWWLEECDQLQKGGIVEKSRDMGVTWLCCAYAAHKWLFRQGDATGFGSRKLELVDKLGDPDSIFEKIRFLLRHQPDWLLPRGFNPNGSRGMGQAKIINPANGSIISGEGGDQIGRGGRKRRYFVDESAYLERPKLIDASLFMNTNVRIDVSTPNCPGNPFAAKRNSGKWRVFRFHWRDDPRKDDAWYQEQLETQDPVIVAQEVDIDFSASIEGICIPNKWIMCAVDFLPEDAVSGHKIGGWDVADEGKNRNVLGIRQGPRIGEVISWNKLDTFQSCYKVREEAALRGVHTLYYDNVGLGLGAKGDFRAMEGNLPFKVVGINGGAAPTEDVWPDGRTSKEMFFNLRSELWWKMRRRFERTFEVVMQNVEHPLEDCISIPNIPELIRDLGAPLVFRTETGKIKLESKIDMAKRGVPSPDYGDGCAYTMAGNGAPTWSATARVMRARPQEVSAFAGMDW